MQALYCWHLQYSQGSHELPRGRIPALWCYLPVALEDRFAEVTLENQQAVSLLQGRSSGTDTGCTFMVVVLLLLAAD